MGQKVHPLGFRLGITQEHKGQWFEEMKSYPNSVYQDFVLRNCLLNSFKNADITSIDIERSFNQVVIKITAARSRLLITNIKQITNYLNVLLKFMTINEKLFGSGNVLTSATTLANTNLTDASSTNLNKWNSKIGHIKHILNRRLSSSKEGLPPVNTQNGHKQDFNDLQENQIFLGEMLESDESTKSLETAVDYEPRLSLLIGSSSQESISNSAFLTAKVIQEQLEKRIPFRRAVKVALRKSPTPKGIKIQVSGRLNGAEIARSEWTRQGRVPLHTLRAQVDYCSHEAKTQYGILGIKVWIFQGYKD